MNHHDTETLISELVDNLQPVRPLRFAGGFGLVLVGLGFAAAVVLMNSSLRSDLAAGNPAPLLVISLGLFLLLGFAAALAVVGMARPRVGTDHDGWKWAAAMTALLPFAALTTLIGQTQGAAAGLDTHEGLSCLTIGLASSVATFAGLTWWLRRGAPTYPEQAGLLVGIAAGSFGMFAAALHCPWNDIVHIGVWHGLAVVAGALTGRAVVPGLVRW